MSCAWQAVLRTSPGPLRGPGVSPPPAIQPASAHAIAAWNKQNPRRPARILCGISHRRTRVTEHAGTYLGEASTGNSLSNKPKVSSVDPLFQVKSFARMFILELPPQFVRARWGSLNPDTRRSPVLRQISDVSTLLARHSPEVRPRLTETG